MKIDVFLGRKLIPSKLAGNESYEIEIKKLPFSELEDAILAGRFNDSKVITALYLARLHLEKEKQSVWEKPWPWHRMSAKNHNCTLAKAIMWLEEIST